jgi:hypothetical protein
VSPSTIIPSASPTTTINIPTKAPLIWNQHGPEINGDADNNKLGTVVAVSADARTIAIGALGSWWVDSKKGCVNVYRIS